MADRPDGDRGAAGGSSKREVGWLVGWLGTGRRQGTSEPAAHNGRGERDGDRPRGKHLLYPEERKQPAVPGKGREAWGDGEGEALPRRSAPHCPCGPCHSWQPLPRARWPGFKDTVARPTRREHVSHEEDTQVTHTVHGKDLGPDENKKRPKLSGRALQQFQHVGENAHRQGLRREECGSN